MKRLSMKMTRGVIAGLLLALAGLTSAPTAQAATVYYVDDDSSTACAPIYNSISHANPLQDAIEDAKINKVHTIKVCGGSYPNIIINQVNGLTITPKDPAERPEIYPTSGNDGVVILVLASKKVVIDGLYINGTYFSHAGGGSMVGIAFVSSDGTIRNNLIRDMRDTVINNAAYGVGISAENSVVGSKTLGVKIQNNMIVGYETGAIRVDGRIKATISGNVIDGANGNTTNGTPDYAIGLRATDTGAPSGSITKNQIYSNVTSISLENTGKISINSNIVSRSTAIGVEITTYCDTDGQNASNNKISNNTFHEVGILGVWLISAADGSIPTVCTPHLDNTLISKNQFTAKTMNVTQAINISVSNSNGTSYSATAAKTKITGNTAWGFSNMETETGATGTSLSKNTIYHK